MGCYYDTALFLLALVRLSVHYQGVHEGLEGALAALGLEEGEDLFKV
jgi:hypothetical protein